MTHDGKGQKSPFEPTRSVVPNAFCEGSPNIGTRVSPPFQLSPKFIKSFWVELEEGTFPSSINRHVERSERSPLQSKGAKVPLSNLPRERLKIFLGGVGGGSVHLLDLKRRPLAKSARGDKYWEGDTPSQLTPKRQKFFLGGVGGGSAHPFRLLICRRCRKF